MAKKEGGFQAKIAKTAAGAASFAAKCPKCGEPIQPVKLVASERTAQGSYKYNERHIGSCKCTAKEIYG
jgi:hypothetical protein